MITDALKTKEGTIFLAAAGLVLVLDCLLLISTVNALRHQDAMAEAVGLFHRNESKAKQALHDLRDQGAAPRVLLGAWYYERAKDDSELDSAKKLFIEALAAEPGRTSAAVGLAAVILKGAADKKPAARAAAAEEAESALNQASDDTSPDVRAMKGAIALMRGKPQVALGLLEQEPETAPSLEGEGARWWNLGVAKLLLKKPDAFEALAVGFQMRRWPIPDERGKRTPAKPKGDGKDAKAADDAEAGKATIHDGEKLLVAAFRMAAADPELKPSEAEAVAKRCARLERLVNLTFSGGAGLRGGQRGRFLPHEAEMPPVYNAIGMGYYRIKKYAEAAKMFGKACDSTRRSEPLYLLNEAQCAYQAGITAPEKSKERDKLLDQAARAFESIVNLLREQKGRKQQVTSCLTNAVAIYGKMGKWRKARDHMARHRKTHPSESEWNRHMGVLLDHTDSRRCVDFYRKAIQAGHPDDVTMQRRIRYWAGRQ